MTASDLYNIVYTVGVVSVVAVAGVCYVLLKKRLDVDIDWHFKLHVGVKPKGDE